MRVGAFELSVLVHGRPLREYPHAEEYFVEGRKDSPYSLRLVNHESRRALAVLSIDGLSVMDGKEASINGGGYVLNPYQTMDVPGWRLNDQNVAAFVFSSLPEAYASEMGKPANIGVIGCAFFLERAYDVMIGASAPHDTLASSPSRDWSGVGAQQYGTFTTATSTGIGTGFGARAIHNVQQVPFNREVQSQAQCTIRYDDREGLRARGVTIESSHTSPDRVTTAVPFPADRGGCTPPAGWRR